MQQQILVLAADRAQAVGNQFAVQPVGGQQAGARHLVRRMLAEHVAHQPDHVEMLRHRFAGGRKADADRRALAHIEAGTAPRLQESLRYQPVVGLDHGKAGNTVGFCELPDRRHARAAAQQPLFDARFDGTHDLVHERFAGLARQDLGCRDAQLGHFTGFGCIGHFAMTVDWIILLTVLVLYWFCRLG